MNSLEEANRLKPYEDLEVKIKDALVKGNYGPRIAATSSYRNLQRKAFQELEGVEVLREKVRSTKLQTIEDIDTYLPRLVKSLESAGIHVFQARDGEEALKYILNLAREKRAKKIVKAKSMVSEEIGVRHFLEGKGIEVIETDLGERIIQLADEKPGHILVPAIHKSVDEIAELFSKDLGRAVSKDPEEIVKLARARLRREFLEAEIGITGANAAVAENGLLFLASNEGNGRLSISLPEVHLAIFGMEKIVPTLEDAFDVLSLLGRSATGQKLTSYVTVIHGPIPHHLQDGKKELHVIILDNGRSEARSDERFRDSMLCLRCGACLNTCPTYRVVGGDVFGHVYTGPIGIPYTYLTGEKEKAMEIAPLCVSCGLCEGVCPVHIKIPEMIMHVKEMGVKKYGEPKVNKFIASLDGASKSFSAMAPISNWLMGRKSFRTLMEFITGIDRRRPFPKYERETLEKWFAKRKVGRQIESHMKVAYFTDIYANHNEPQLGKAVIELLESNSVEIALPRQKSAAMHILAYGNLDKALPSVKYNVKSLSEWVRKGYKVISSEPTASYCLKLLYPHLVKDDDAQLVSKNTYELFEFLNILQDQGQLMAVARDEYREKKMAYHAPCHTKSVFWEWPVPRFLKGLGIDATPIDVTCCGIAGSYGYKKGYGGYELSMKVGEELFKKIDEINPEVILTESSVCKLQIEHGTGRRVVHPIYLLASQTQDQIEVRTP